MKDYNILSLASDIIKLIREHELEKGADLVKEAEKKLRRVSWDNRRDKIFQINKNIKDIQEQKKIIRHSISCLPNPHRFFAEIEIQRVIEMLFEEEIVYLKREKRRPS